MFHAHPRRWSEEQHGYMAHRCALGHRNTQCTALHPMHCIAMYCRAKTHPLEPCIDHRQVCARTLNFCFFGLVCCAWSCHVRPDGTPLELV